MPAKNAFIPLPIRLWGKVFVSGECMLWSGSKDKDGYGLITLRTDTGKTSVGAHRLSWELFHKTQVPSGMYVLHTCDTPSCVNPLHLYIGNQFDNMRDCVTRGRNVNKNKTHCAKGHPYSVENTVFAKCQRVCKVCRRSNDAKRRSL